MAFPSQNQMIDDIKSEIILDVTFMVKTIASIWDIVKQVRPTNDDEIAASLLVAQADDLLSPWGDERPIKHVYIVDPMLFAQLSLRVDDAHRLDQNFAGLPVWATPRDEKQLEEFLPELVRQRQETIWQDAIKQARQRFHFTDHTDRSVPSFGRVAPWRNEAWGDMEREQST